MRHFYKMVYFSYPTWLLLCAIFVPWYLTIAFLIHQRNKIMYKEEPNMIEDSWNFLFSDITFNKKRYQRNKYEVAKKYS